MSLTYQEIKDEVLREIKTKTSTAAEA